MPSLRCTSFFFILFTLAAFFLFGLSLPAPAQDHPFATSCDEMLDQLRAPRSGLTRGFVPTRNITIATKTSAGTSTATVAVPVNDTGPKCYLKIEFDVDSAALRPGSFKLVSEVATALNAPDMAGRRFIVRGHTDADGGEDYNLNLSVARAAAVVELLAAFGVAPDRLVVQGCGEALPIEDNDTVEHKQLNRRVEVRPVE